MATLVHLTGVLDQLGETYHVLEVGGGFRALLTQRGARVLGLFPVGEGAAETDSLFWTPDAWESADDVRAMIDSGNWNIGGERFWVAPEVQYHAQSREDFLNTLVVPPAVDPGRYNMEVDGDIVHFDQEVTVTARHLATGEKQLFIGRTTQPAPDPLRGQHRATYGGYLHSVMLEDSNPEEVSAHSELWNLIQLVAEGSLLIPTVGDPQVTDFFGEVPIEVHTPVQDRGAAHLRVNISGRRMFKIGVQSLSVIGRMGYHLRRDGREYLLVRQFFNNPSNVYSEEPPHLVGHNGHSVFVYNDHPNGEKASFGEMECLGQTVGGSSGRTSTEDTFVLWVYAGDSDAIRDVGYRLLGIDL